MNYDTKWKSLKLTATYFFLPKKHMPMLFQSGGLSGTVKAATRYLFMATSKSPCVCIMLPAARMAWEEKKKNMDSLYEKWKWHITFPFKSKTYNWNVLESFFFYLVIVWVIRQGIPKMFKGPLIFSELRRNTRMLGILCIDHLGSEEQDVCENWPACTRVPVWSATLCSLGKTYNTHSLYTGRSFFHTAAARCLHIDMNVIAILAFLKTSLDCSLNSKKNYLFWLENNTGSKIHIRYT